jgi:sigma-B regulation protein RsbU (phosphoserine phosphatase)
MRDGTMGFAVGDVSGHGFAPALIMACTHVLFRSLVETHDELEEILTLANAVLLRETDEFRFVTLLFACLDPDEQTLAYAGAGHPAGYVLDAAGNVRHRLRSMGLPLGLFEEAEYSAAAPLSLHPGDTVLLLTDGFAEARSPDGEFFGTERALEFVRANRHRRAADVAHGLCRAACDFAQRTTPLDDTTVIVIRVDPTA